MAASEEEISQVEGIGPIIAKGVADVGGGPGQSGVWLRNWGQAGVRLEDEVESQRLLVTCWPGRPSWSREPSPGSAVRRLRPPSSSGAARRPGSVSGKTTALIVGDSPGASKSRKAEELGVPILDGESFKRLLEEGLSALPV